MNQSACDPDFVGTRYLGRTRVKSLASSGAADVLDPADTPVVVLCGVWESESARPARLPKPLVDIGGKPILWSIMKAYCHCGFRRFMVPLGYESDQTKRYVLGYRRHSSDFTLHLAADLAPHFLEVDPVEDLEITFGHRTHDWHRPNRCGSS